MSTVDITASPHQDYPQLGDAAKIL
jgi:hypothetical protein